ncbi:LURP-one-related family protein [Clostridium sp. 19966]|uniref:LURP-one-related/scramblase family protein n=1 Tax=Clostridium sp. 19966 TaxID=2768166 RepID=UPI0028E00879|nr:LURP-one-related family protein [Clostridium sp. 19966]MDT8719303.1 LURP-one-related family protein [Clostridium sp. 19966]
MRYIMKQRMFSFGDSFTIKDEFENDIFYVRGQVFSIGKKLSFESMDGEELLFIKQKLMSFVPVYEIYRGEELMGVVKKQMMTLFKPKFDIQSQEGDIQIEGDVWTREYDFWKNGINIAKVSKEFFAWSDTYGIDVIDGEYDAFILACVVIIDMICYDNDNR